MNKRMLITLELHPKGWTQKPTKGVQFRIQSGVITFGFYQEAL